MNDDFELSSWELEQLKRLPPLHQQFAERYPVAISNVIDRLDSPPLPEGYKPKWIDFYYFDGAEEPHIAFVKGELKYINLPENIAESRIAPEDKNATDSRGSRCDGGGASESAEPQRIEGVSGWFTPSSSQADTQELPFSSGALGYCVSPQNLWLKRLK